MAPSCEATTHEQICGRPLDQVLPLLEAPGAAQDRSLWAVIFCPKIASDIVGYLIDQGIQRNTLVQSFADMGPGHHLPALLTHSGLMLPMYCQLPALWNAASRLLMQAVEDWMDTLIQDGVFVYQHDPATRRRRLAVDAATLQLWTADHAAMQERIDLLFFDTSRLELADLTEVHRDTRRDQIPHLLGDLNALPDDPQLRTPRQAHLLDELDRLLSFQPPPPPPPPPPPTAAPSQHNMTVVASTRGGATRHNNQGRGGPAININYEADRARMVAHYGGHMMRSAYYGECLNMSYAAEGRVMAANTVQRALMQRHPP